MMAGEDRQRIDKWLFFARVVKSRSLAAKLVQAGRVRINGEKTIQAAHQVKPGDVLTIGIERRIVVFRVRAPGIRRGPAEEARTLYDDLSPLPAPPGTAPADAAAPLRQAGSGRPTKKDRREMEKFRDGD
jgi:ribosome-associated heat shock protein Hsp15